MHTNSARGLTRDWNCNWRKCFETGEKMHTARSDPRIVLGMVWYTSWGLTWVVAGCKQNAKEKTHSLTSYDYFETNMNRPQNPTYTEPEICVCTLLGSWPYLLNKICQRFRALYSLFWSASNTRNAVVAAVINKSKLKRKRGTCGQERKDYPLSLEQYESRAGHKFLPYMQTYFSAWCFSQKLIWMHF